MERADSDPTWLGKDSKSRQTAYRGLFQSELDFDVINDIRQALTHN